MEAEEPAREREREREQEGGKEGGRERERWRKAGSIPATAGRGCLRRDGAECSVRQGKMQGPVYRTNGH